MYVVKEEKDSRNRKKNTWEKYKISERRRNWWTAELKALVLERGKQTWPHTAGKGWGSLYWKENKVRQSLIWQTEPSKAGDAMGGTKVSSWRPEAVQCETKISVIKTTPEGHQWRVVVLQKWSGWSLICSVSHEHTDGRHALERFPPELSWGFLK